MTFRADPFALDERNIVFEHYDYWMRKGKIHCLTFDDNFKIIAEKEILHHEKHLSYPFIIKHEGRIFMVCESYKSNNLSLYEIDQKTLRAKKLREIFANKAAIDPTIFYHNEKFWLFYSSRENPDVELNIAFADSENIKSNPLRWNSPEIFSKWFKPTPSILDLEKLSFIDCIGYYLAKKNKAKFLTGDEKFKNMENVEFVK